MAALRPLLARPVSAKCGVAPSGLGRVRLSVQTPFAVPGGLRNVARAASHTSPSPWPVFNSPSQYNQLMRAWSLGWLWPFGSSSQQTPPPESKPKVYGPSDVDAFAKDATFSAHRLPSATPPDVPALKEYSVPAFTQQVASGDKLEPVPKSSMVPAASSAPPPAEPSALSAPLSPAAEAVAGAAYSFTPVYFAQLFLMWFHEFLGAGWVLPVVLTTIFVRAIVFYPTVMQTRNAAKMVLLRPHIEELQERFKKRSSAGRASPEDQKAMKEEYARLMSFHGVSPIKTMLSGLVAAPFFITLFLSLRSLPERFPNAGLDTGGLAWFRDLSLADPYCILPLLSTSITILTIELGSDSGGSQANVKIKRFFQGVMLISLIIFIKFPALVFLYWISNGLMTLGVSQFLKLPKVRKALDIPIIPPAAAAAASESASKGFFGKLFGTSDSKKVQVAPPVAKPPPAATKLDPSLHIKKADVPQTFAQRPKRK